MTDIISTGILVVFALLFLGREISFVRAHDRSFNKQVTIQNNVPGGHSLDAYLRLRRDVDLQKIELCVKQWEEEKSRASGTSADRESSKQGSEVTYSDSTEHKSPGIV